MAQAISTLHRKASAFLILNEQIKESLPLCPLWYIYHIYTKVVGCIVDEIAHVGLKVHTQVMSELELQLLPSP